MFGRCPPYFVLSIVVTASICSVVLGQPVDRIDLLGTAESSEAVYPPRQYPIRFQHRVHTSFAECGRCHQNVELSEYSREDLLPSMGECGSCHLEASDTEDGDACSFCHAGYRPVWSVGQGMLDVRDPRFPQVGPPLVVNRSANLTFAHSLHSEQPCASCHIEDDTEDPSLPREELCLNCHEEQRAALVCSTCHPADDNGRIITEFAGDALSLPRRLRPSNHDLGWINGHATEVAVDPAGCMVCHSERDCITCHAGTAGLDSHHPPGFAAGHAAEARRQSSSCSSCHLANSFCVGCHLDTGVGDEDPHRPPMAESFHDDGWLGGEGGHGYSAQLNIVECSSCHQESYCAACHASSVNPHGIEFYQRCGPLLDANPGMCMQCHDEEAFGILRSRCR